MDHPRGSRAALRPHGRGRWVHGTADRFTVRSAPAGTLPAAAAPPAGPAAGPRRTGPAHFGQHLKNRQGPLGQLPHSPPHSPPRSPLRHGPAPRTPRPPRTSNVGPAGRPARPARPRLSASSRTRIRRRRQLPPVHHKPASLTPPPASNSATPFSAERASLSCDRWKKRGQIL